MGLTHFERHEKRLTLQVLKNITGNREDNVAISPLAIRSQLAMLLMGSAGKSSEELCMAVGLHPQYPKREVARIFRSLMHENLQYSTDIKLAQKIFLQIEHDVKPQTDHFLEKYFESCVAQVCFRNVLTSTATINSFITTKTENLVHKLNTHVTDKEDMLMVGTIYCDLILDTGYETMREIAPAPFCVNEKENVVVPMIFSQGIFKYGIIKPLKATAVGINLRSNFQLMMFLPDCSKAMKSLIHNSKLLDFTMVLKNMKEQPLNLKIPQFQLDSEINLVEHLQLPNVFNEIADFSELCKSSTPKLQKCIHKVKLNFSGKSETQLQADPRMFTPTIPEFNANRPFVFLVRNRSTNLVLFAGVVKRPLYPTQRVKRKMAKTQSTESLAVARCGTLPPMGQIYGSLPKIPGLGGCSTLDPRFLVNGFMPNMPFMQMPQFSKAFPPHLMPHLF